MIDDNTTPVTPITDKPVKEKAVEAPVVDIHVSQRKTFRIDGDNDRRISLDTSDLNVITRLEEVYPKIKQSAIDAMDKLSKMEVAEEEEDTDTVDSYSSVLIGIDKDMRELLDYAFDAPVSDACVPKGTMYDPYNGEFRFEHIIDVLSQLYANNLTSEFRKMKERVSKKTAKYTKRKK